MSLPLRLFAFVVLPLIVAVAAVGAWTLSALEQQLAHRLQREVEMVARALQLPVSEAITASGYASAQPALDSAFAIRRVYGAYVYDGSGSLVASSGPQQASAPRFRTSNVVVEGERTGQYDELDGKEMYSYFVPLSGPGREILGVLRVTREKSDLKRYIRALRVRGLAIATGSGLVLCAVVMIGYAVALGRSLRDLVSSIHRVSSGDRSHRAEVKKPREIGAVAEVFNDMLDSLARAEERAKQELRIRKEAQQRLDHVERLAAIGRLTAGVAHELGTPLSTVAGHAQRLLRRRDLPPGTREPLSSLRSETFRMASLIRQLLDYGARRQGRRITTSAGTLASSALEAVAPLLEEGNVRVEFKRDAAAERDCILSVDAPRIEQALVNLLRNAIHAAKAKVELSFRAAKDWVEFVVDDDGPGVNDALLSRLYEPFVTDKQAVGGTGLGLAIVAAVADEHGGTVSDHESPLGGARFVLRTARE